MNFRDFQYSFGKFKTNVEGQIVRNISYKNRNTKQLSLWIFRERDDLSSLRTLAYQHSETNKALLQWINEEAQYESDSEEDKEEGEERKKRVKEHDNYDLKDLVGDKIVELLNKQVEIEQGYADQIQSYRQVIKSIRIREEQVANIREHSKVLQYRLTQLDSKKSKKNGGKIADLQAQIESVEEEKQQAESELAGFKRMALREAFYIRFNALSEYAEKASMIAGFGKYLTDLLAFNSSSGIDYNKYNQQVANTIFSDAMQALNQWVPTQSDERPTLSGSLMKDMSKDKNRNNNNNKKNKFKKGKNKKDKDEPENEEEPLTPPELPPRQHHVDSLDYHHQQQHHSGLMENTGSPSSSSSNPPGLLYRHREYSSGSTSSCDSKEEHSSSPSKPYQEAPPPSYTAYLSTTSLNENLNDDTTTPSQVVRPVEEHTDHDDSGPTSSSPCSFFSYQPFEQIHQQIQNKKDNKRSYMDFSQQYTHRPVLQLSRPFEPTLLPPPLPRSRSIASIPISLTAAPSAPTEDEIDFLPIPSAPPPSEFN